MSTKKLEVEKSLIVLKAEKTFSFFNLVCHEVIKELDEVSSRLTNIGRRTYTIPRVVTYYFTYDLNRQNRYLKLERKAGNSQTLETNIKKALTKEFENDLKEFIKKGGK